MSSRLSTTLKAAVLCGLLIVPACAPGGSSSPVAPGTAPGSSGTVQTLSQGGSGPPQIPPNPTIDGPAWFIFNENAVANAVLPNPGVNFDSLVGDQVGGIGIGTSRSTPLIVFNDSKKSALTITSITVTGTNPGDFSIDPASLQAALAKPLPIKAGALIVSVVFDPVGKGVRTATLQFVSNAGTALVQVTGNGLAAKPKIKAPSALAFIPESAPVNTFVQNAGGRPLTITSVTLQGANPGAFQLGSVTRGGGFCVPDTEIILAPLTECEMAIGLAAGATPPASAYVAILTDDPVHPEHDIQLTLGTMLPSP